MDEGQALNVLDVIVPVMLVDNTSPAEGISEGPTARPTSIDSSDRPNVVEASAAAILAAANTLLNMVRFALRGDTFNGDRQQQSAGAYSKKILAEAFTATAGGEIAAADLVPAVAGYQACCRITGIWSDQTDAGIAMAFTAAGGAVIPIASWTMVTTAGAVTDYSPGVPLQSDTDAVAIQMACAAGQAGANQVVVIIGEYWYET